MYLSRKKCRYCGLEFHFNYNDPEAHRLANQERDIHESVCTERFWNHAPYNEKFEDNEDRDIRKILELMSLINNKKEK